MARLTPTGYPHITRDQNGVLRIAGTGYKALLLLDGYLTWSCSEDEFLASYQHLTKAQLHAMLAYYYDHQAEIDAELASGWVKTEQLRADAQTANPELYARLRETLTHTSVAREVETTPT
jgi:uncharacterized protein (DUF433 family)